MSCPVSGENVRSTVSARSSASTRGGTRYKPAKICFLGIFGVGNLGNNATLEAVLSHTRRWMPGADITCICTGPERVTAIYNINSVPISGDVIKGWHAANILSRALRKVFIAIPSELCRLLRVWGTVRRADMLIVPGTGVLTDAFGFLSDASPYTVCKWVLLAKISGCRVHFLSVGAGPIYGRISRFLVKVALASSRTRSYRDLSTKDYLKSIGFRSDQDRTYPDLVFSLPVQTDTKSFARREHQRSIVGIGVMEYSGRYGETSADSAAHAEYLRCLAALARSLLRRGYEVRILVGDTSDEGAACELENLLRESAEYYRERVINQPAHSVDHLIAQLAATDFVVATRFHNVLMALLLNKPAISVSFHHKCSSLMAQFGLSEYCREMHQLSPEWLIAQFSSLEENAEHLKHRIKQRVEEFQRRLGEQYETIFDERKQTSFLTGAGKSKVATKAAPC